MKKLVVKFLMLLFVLGMSTNAAWAGGNISDMLGNLPAEAQQQIMSVYTSQTYCAKLTGHASSTGGGKVYVINSDAENDDPRGNTYVEGTSNVSVNGMGMAMEGMTKIGIAAWAKPDDGYYLAGWSYSNMGTDLGPASDVNHPNVYFAQYDIAIKEHETIDHVIYGTFEPIRIANFTVSGTNEINDLTCTQTVTFSLVGTDIVGDDFKPLSISSQTGTGTWTPDELLIGDDNMASVTVTFTAPNADVAEYSANLVLETKAGIKINVPLYARVAISGVEAVRYDKNGDERGRGDLNVMLAAANSTDVVKLCADYNSPLTIAKSVTLDLNGHNLQVLAGTAITVNGGATLTLAFSPYGGQIQGLVQQGILVKSGSKAILKGGTIVNNNIGVKVEANAELELNGATVAGNTTAAIDNAGKVTTFDGVVIGLVKTSGTFEANGGSFRNVDESLANTNHTGGHAIQVEGGNAQLNKGDFTGETYSVYSKGSANVSIEKLAVIVGSPALHAEGNSRITVNCGKFVDPAYLFVDPSNPDEGIEMVSMFFKENVYGITSIGDKKVWRNTAGAEYRDGYNFFGGTAEDAQMAGVSVCHIGGNSYAALEDAFDYANGTNEIVVIIMDNDYTLPAGFYTLPANATLLIPNSNEQGAPNAIVPREETLSTPTLFRKLTLANGVNINVYGTIEVSGTQYADNNAHTGAVTGDYAQLQMNKGSRMTLQNGSVLRAWGFVTGDVENKSEAHNVPAGEIDARRGASVFEMFQMGDWGNTFMNAVGLVTKDTRFPINSYFIQNVEVPVKYHPGAKLTAVTAVAIPNLVKMCANNIQIIGVTDQDVAMFLMDAAADEENTWVRKWYDASKDQQVYEINSGAHIGNLVINLASSPLLNGLENYTEPLLGISMPEGVHFEQDLVMNSGQYVLPITFNFKLHLLSGTLDFTQNAALIPGSELEIDKEARVFVTDQDDDDVLEGSLYIYDYYDWGEGNHKVNYTPSFDDGVNNGNVPDEVRDVSSAEAMGHAKVNVHGTFDTSAGYIFTTATGGNIFSSVGDAGTFKFSAEGKSDPEEIKKGTSGYVQCYPAWLRNSDKWVESNGGDEEFRYVKTEGTQQDRSYCYLDFDGKGGRWTLLEQRGCFTYDDADDSYYINPQEYVKVLVTSAETNNLMWTIEGNADHTFSDAAGAGRLFILLNDESFNCHWWEVEKEGNYYHCIHPENDTYYEWNPDNEEWQEVKFTITWKDKNWAEDETEDKILATYTVPYGTQAEWRTDDPIRPSSIDYTYDFAGWTPALGKVTSDVTYTATYQEKQIKYTVVFVNDGGVEIERHLLARNEYPECENEPTRPGYTLEWTPAVAAVTKDTTYTATWKLIPPTEYEITFYDYNGTTVLKQGNVAVGTVPAPPENPTGKPATAEYTYVFDRWSPALEEVSATSAKIYTAVYREEAQTYTISYYQEDGETLNTSEELPYGATPTPPTVSKEDPVDGHTYTLVWKNLAETATIQTVTGEASYKPTYLDAINKYQVSVMSNPSGACAISGAGIYDYSTSATAVTITITPNSGYTFTGWSDGLGDTNTTRQMAITDDINLVANFNVDDPDYTITWNNEDGSLIYEMGQKANTATIFTGATPTKGGDAQYSYIFDGWVTDMDYPAEGEFYKNNMTPKATANATYYAHFTPVVNQYTIYWKNETGTADIEVDYNQPYGAAIAYNSATPTKQATAQYTYAFDGWSTSVGGDVVALPTTVSGDATYYAHFAATPKTYTVTWKRDDGSLIDNTEVAYGVTPSHADPTKPATPQYSYEFTGWDRPFEEVTGITSYTASFSKTTNKYTITWLDGDGNELDTDELEYGATPSYEGANPTKSATAEYTYTFNGTWSPSIVNVTGDATYTAQFDATPIEPAGDDLEIGLNQSEDLNGEVVERTNLVITSNGVDASGQLFGAENLTITGEAIFRLEQDFADSTWYAVAVPWTVDPSTGIYNAAGNHLATGAVYVIEFYANAYASADRESGRTDYWRFLDVTGNDMEPGKLYMVYLAAGTTALEFHKKDGASIWTTSTSVSTASGSIAKQSNWNAIANPALYYADMTIANTYGDVLKYNGGDTYVVASSTNMVVGQPIFAQVSTPSTVEATPVGGGSSAPYRRVLQETMADNRFVVELTHNGNLADRMIVQTADEKANEYVIGMDLAKMSVSTKVAQMWMNRYDAKLCKNTVEMTGDHVDYPLAISAPVAGEYILTATQQRGYEELYLTHNGEAIWNLSESDYVLMLENGTDANYGLRISLKAPQITTGVDEAIVDAKGETRKVLINDQVFIIRGNNVYSIDGQLIR